VGAPDARLFPFDEWRRLVARQIRASKLGGAYGDPAGVPRLRAAIARQVAVSRGVRAGEDDILVTQGAQQALDLVGRVLLEPGAEAAVEDPGYPPARLVFESLGARVARVPVDAGGLVVDALPDQARVVYVTPSHQFPMGMPMSHARRLALLDWAERRNAVIVEDDYDSEFRFGGRPLETLQAMDRTGRVIYVGSFSKVMLPALRLGFLVAPVSLVRPLTAAAFVAGWHCHWPAQAALASFIEDGLLARHARKMRREYAARHQRILGALQRDFTPWLEPVPSETGMHLCARLRPARLGFEREVHERALASGVRFDRLSGYSARSRAGLVLGYGSIAVGQIDEGLRRLRACFSPDRGPAR
jgi:GntR family transcriptional regulator/MocR family aminotransferase